MTREELVELRTAYLTRLKQMRQVGDYGAGAADARETAEALLQIIDHLLERMRKP